MFLLYISAMVNNSSSHKCKKNCRPRRRSPGENLFDRMVCKKNIECYNNGPSNPSPCENKQTTIVISQSDAINRLKHVQAIIKNISLCLTKFIKCEMDTLARDISGIVTGVGQKETESILSEAQRLEREVEKIIACGIAGISSSACTLITENSNCTTAEIVAIVKQIQNIIVAQFNAQMSLDDAALAAWVRDLTSGAVPFILNETNKIIALSSEVIYKNGQGLAERLKKIIADEAAHLLSNLGVAFNKFERKVKQIIAHATCEEIKAINCAFEKTVKYILFQCETIMNNNFFKLIYLLKQIIEKATGSPFNDCIIPLMFIDQGNDRRMRM